MANVTIAGATYSDVPAIQVPSGSGTALFYETKDVTYNLTGGASASVTPSEVVAGQGFSVKLKAPAGYELSNVSVTMGGVDITSQVFTPDEEGGGGGGTYVRTEILAQQTFTGDSSQRRATLTGLTEGFVDGDYYIVTYDGVEWLTTCETLWSTNYCIGEAMWFLSTGDAVYQFGVIWTSGTTATVAAANTSQHTVKIEHLEFIEDGVTLGTKTITQNGIYMAEDDELDGYSDVTVNVPWSWMGSEVEPLGTLYEHDFTLNDTTFGSWTASTTAGSILATANVATFAADMSQYEYFLHWTFRLDAAYTSGATLKAIPYRECQDAWQHCLRRPNSLATIADNDFLANGCVTVMTAPLLDYYNTSGTRTYTYSNSNGIYPTVQAATFSNSTSDTPTVTVKRPIIYAKCSNSYFATSRKASIDTTNTKFTLKCEAFRVPIGGIARVAYQNLINTYNAT